MILRFKYIVWIITVVLITSIISYFVLQDNKSEISNDVLQNISNENDIVIGDYNVKKSVILFYDYNCIYCKKFFKEIYPIFKKEYINNHKAKLILKPICKVTDKQALNAYQTLICINKYGDFQKLHKLLLHKSKIIYTDYFRQLIDDYIFTNDFVAECILNTKQFDIKKNISQFQKLNTKGTPTFIIGNKIIKGYKNYKAFKSIINSELKL